MVSKVKVGISALKTREAFNELFFCFGALFFLYFFLSEIGKRRVKATAVTRIVEQPTFNTQLTSLGSALKSQLVGSLQSSWGRVHRKASV